MPVVSIVPALRVASIAERLPLWHALGFSLAFAHGDEGPLAEGSLEDATFARLDAEGGRPVCVFLQVGGGVAGAHVHLMLERPEEVDATCARLRAAGFEPWEPPTDRPWGMRDLWVRDADGNEVVVGAAT